MNGESDCECEQCNSVFEATNFTESELACVYRVTWLVVR